VDLPHNTRRSRRFGKHDTADAEAAARAVQADVASGEPKSADGIVEMMRALRVARRSAVKARTQAANQLRALLFKAPEESVGSVKERWQMEVMRDGESPPPLLKACPPHLRPTA